MTLNEYQKLAMRTANGMNNEELLLNGCMGMCGEAGEVIDLVKKATFQGHELDAEKLCEEVGDVLWYVAIILQGIGVSLEECAAGNIEKLRKRYPDGFEAERSVNR